MDDNEVKCIVTFYGDNWYRRLQMTKGAYRNIAKGNIKRHLQELMEDLGGNTYTYEVIK